MVDIEDLKSSAGYSVRVRVPPWAHEYKMPTSGRHFVFTVPIEEQMTCVICGDSNRGRETASSTARQFCDRVPPWAYQNGLAASKALCFPFIENVRLFACSIIRGDSVTLPYAMPPTMGCPILAI